MSVPTITIWRFHEAPAELQRLSQHGGDEDWLVRVSATLRGCLPANLAELDGFDTYMYGFGHIDRHDLPDGDLVVIFAHA